MDVKQSVILPSFVRILLFRRRKASPGFRLQTRTYGLGIDVAVLDIVLLVIAGDSLYPRLIVRRLLHRMSRLIVYSPDPKLQTLLAGVLNPQYTVVSVTRDGILSAKGDILLL